MDNSSDSEEEAGLTQEQLDKLAQLQDLTGIEDTNICRALLDSNNWDLESTAREHLGIHQEEEDHQQRPMPNPDPDLPNLGQPDPGGLEQMYQHIPQNQQQREQRGAVGSRALRRHAGGGNSLVSLLMYILSMPLRIVTTSIDGAMGFITSLFGFPPRRRSTVRDPQRDVSKFVAEFEEAYGSEHPEFFVGSYSQVLEEAKKELKFLLIYLHSEDHQDTDRFCTDVLSNQELRSYISENFIVWGCSVKYPEGHRVSEALRESTYPFLAVVVLRQHRMVVVGRQEGYIQAQPLVTWLEKTVREYESFIVAARADRDERNFTREIRNEQDALYEETLRQDQEREEQKREEEVRQLQAEEEERLQEEAERRRVDEEHEKKSRIQNMKIELASEVPSEPELSCKEAIRILIKLPEGQRLERRFLPTHTMHHLYYFVFCHPDSPDEFDIVTNFPRRVLACKPDDEPLTLAAAGFGRSEMLFVNDLDA
jgi:FAS-associated factor 2